MVTTSLTLIRRLLSERHDVTRNVPITKRTMAPAAIDQRMVLTDQPRLESPDLSCDLRSAPIPKTITPLQTAMSAKLNAVNWSESKGKIYEAKR